MAEHSLANRTIEIWADTKGEAKCRGCGALLTWAEVVKSGKKMCFTGRAHALHAFESIDGRIIESIHFDSNHWRSCPDAARFDRRSK